MVTPLLRTKLYIPPLRPELVLRPRLIERLNAGLDRKLTLVSAPAGFGKTTLLSEWVDRCVRPVAWLSLDKGDNDLTRFLAYLIAALQTLHKDLGESILPLLQSPHPPSLEVLLARLINEIAECAHPSILVIDDYYAIVAEQIDDAVTFLLDNLPPQMHLVISTRAGPPLQIARLRGRGELTELRQDELRFTLDEATQFLNLVMRLELSADDIAALASRTEGWIAGLQMAAISMQGLRRAQGVRDVSRFIKAFTGSHRFILDYLVGEVLDQQSPAVQEFLLKTAILERLIGPLCDAVTGRGDDLAGLSASGQATLEMLDRINLFIVPLDDERRWYRYHHLFADLLRLRLQQTQPDALPQLHHRASVWYEQQGHTANAIDHALSAGDFDRAARLVEQAAEPTLRCAVSSPFLNWVQALPEEVTRARPLLNVYHAGIQLMDGMSLPVVEARLQEAGETDTSGAVSGAVIAFRALIATYQGNTRRSAELSRRALELLPEESLFLRSFVAGFVGLNYLWSGDFSASSWALQEALRIGRQVGNVTITVLAQCHLAELCALQGRLVEARAFYDAVLERAVDARGRLLPISGIALIGLGYLLREWNDLQAASHHLVTGIELASRWEETATIIGYVHLAGVKQAQGDAEGARQAIQKARQMATEFEGMEIAVTVVRLFQARLWIAQRDFPAAIRWAQERGLDKAISAGELEEGSGSVPSVYRAYEYVALAEMHGAQRRPDGALAILRRLLQVAETSRWTMFVIEILVLQSLAFHTRGDTAQAMRCLQRALSLAEPGGFVRTFVDKGAPMIELLRQAATRGIAVAYVGKLLAALRKETNGDQRAPKLLPSVPRPPSPLIERLTGRELEVLRLIVAGLSNREIAEQLVVATSTVKTHINNMYRKLDVSTRSQAVARARELNLS